MKNKFPVSDFRVSGVFALIHCDLYVPIEMFLHLEHPIF